MTKYGKYNPGETASEADECILTGSHVNFENSIRERVPNTPYFYRVIGHQYENVTDELRAKWRNESPQVVKVAIAMPAKAAKVEVKE